MERMWKYEVSRFRVRCLEVGINGVGFRSRVLAGPWPQDLWHHGMFVAVFSHVPLS